jgi:hypothetical protein
MFLTQTTPEIAISQKDIRVNHKLAPPGTKIAHNILLEPFFGIYLNQNGPVTTCLQVVIFNPNEPEILYRSILTDKKESQHRIPQRHQVLLFTQQKIFIFIYMISTKKERTRWGRIQ